MCSSFTDLQIDQVDCYRLYQAPPHPLLPQGG
jgi:hypothetical protein